MAKPEKRELARQLRLVGYSLRDIAATLKVSKGSVSLWCRDIPFSPLQQKELLESKRQQITSGRLKGSATMHARRLLEIQKLKD